MDFRACLALAIAALSAPAASAACTAVPLLEPARAQVLADRQPVLRWAGAGQATFRVQAVVVLPEARVLATYDVELTGTSFRIPAPIPAEQAGVKVLVTQDCAGLDTQDVQAQGAWFFIDLRDRCAVDRDSLASLEGRLTWSASAGATAYRVRFFREPAAPGASAQPLDEIVATSASLTIPEPLRREAAAASVQAVCGGLAGRPEALPLVRR
jgi:hypothetical protein